MKPGERSITNEELRRKTWNPDVQVEGVWREDLRHLVGNLNLQEIREQDDESESGESEGNDSEESSDSEESKNSEISSGSDDNEEESDSENDIQMFEIRITSKMRYVQCEVMQTR